MTEERGREHEKLGGRDPDESAEPDERFPMPRVAPQAEPVPMPLVNPPAAPVPMPQVQPSPPPGQRTPGTEQRAADETASPAEP